jgi:hypothetical protein
VIPGIYGKIFSTNAIIEYDLIKIKNVLLKMHGIKDVIINMDVFPRELKIITSSLVKIEDIENRVKLTGFHALPKEIF